MRNATEIVHDGQTYLVRVNRIIGCPGSEIVRVYEPRTDHSCIFSDDAGRWWGAVGSGGLPESIDRLPAYSEDRSSAYHAWHDAEVARGRSAACAAARDLGFSPLQIGARDGVHAEFKILEGGR